MSSNSTLRIVPEGSRFAVYRGTERLAVYIAEEAARDRVLEKPSIYTPPKCGPSSARGKGSEA